MILVTTSPVLIGSLIVSLVGLIVVYDILHLFRNKKTVPQLGNLPLGGYAWSSTFNQEIFRNGPNILTLIAMAILPWLLKYLLLIFFNKILLLDLLIKINFDFNFLTLNIFLINFEYLFVKFIYE